MSLNGPLGPLLSPPPPQAAATTNAIGPSLFITRYSSPAFWGGGNGWVKSSELIPTSGQKGPWPGTPNLSHTRRVKTTGTGRLHRFDRERHHMLAQCRGDA